MKKPTAHSQERERPVTGFSGYSAEIMKQALSGVYLDERIRKKIAAEADKTNASSQKREKVTHEGI